MPSSSPNNTTIVIASAARTPVGSFNGALATVPAHELGRVAIKAALALGCGYGVWTIATQSHVTNSSVLLVILGIVGKRRRA